MVARTPALEWLEMAASATTWLDRDRARAAATTGILDELEAMQDKTIENFVSRLFFDPYFSFVPRSDTDGVDEQAGFIDSDAFVACALGGNGSGKTRCAAQKAIDFLCFKQPPPKQDTPFWVIGQNQEQVCDAAWAQKLCEVLPKEWYDPSRIDWWKPNRNFPYAVPLKPWPGRPGKNWTLVFKSYEQGRKAFQGVEAGGAWFTEQFPYEIFEEVFRSVRSYAYPGSVFMEFTPIDPAYSVYIEEMYEAWIEGSSKAENWAFFHLNTIKAVEAGHAKKKWADTFFDAVSEEMRETRTSGAFASYEGTIFKSFNPKLHLLPDEKFPPPPHGVFHKRSIDWGASKEHPFVCLWGYKDCLGTWWIYDEYWSDDGAILWKEHAAEIVARHPWPDNSVYHLQTYADPSRPDCMREFANMGIPIAPARNSWLEGVERVRAMLKPQRNDMGPRLYINKTRCPKLSLQMKTYRYLRASGKGLNPKAPKLEPLKKDDDAVDALRYLLFSDWQYAIQGKAVTAERIVNEPHRSLRFRRDHRR